MNYYEKIIQEKNNARDYDDINKVYKEAKRIVDDLRRKYREISARERDDGNFLYSIIEEKGMPTDSSDRQKARHAAGLLEAARRMSTTPRDWGNSKGETKMGYYADLIKQKQEKRNFRDPLGLGLTFTELGTPDGYKAKFKKGDKVKLRYGSGFKGEGVIVEGPIKMRASLTPTYRIKLTDGKVVGRYEEELAKNSKDNAKEEKDNDSEGRLMEIAEKVLSEYPESTKSYAKFEDRFLTKAGWSYNPAKVRTIKEIWERVANSKEEKDNDDILKKGTFKYGDYKIVKKNDPYGGYYWVEYHHTSGEHKGKTYKGRLHISVKECEEEISRNFNNSKEEKGYYAKIIQEKRNARKIVKGKFYLQGEDARAAISMGKSEIKREVEKKVKNYTSIDVESDGFVEVWMDEKKSPRVKEHFFKAIPYVTEKEIREDGSIYYARYDAKFELQYQGDEPW